MDGRAHSEQGFGKVTPVGITEDSWEPAQDLAAGGSDAEASSHSSERCWMTHDKHLWVGPQKVSLPAKLSADLLL